MDSVGLEGFIHILELVAMKNKGFLYLSWMMKVSVIFMLLF